MMASYYAAYSLEYYEVGTVYSFYARKGDKYAPLSEDETVKKYAKKLDNIEEDLDVYPPSGKFSNLMRLCGVVIEKIQGDGKGSHDKIRVMFKLVDAAGEIVYGEKLYVVNHSGIETDGWEALPVQIYVGAGSFYVGGNSTEVAPKASSKKSDKKGGITLDEGADVKGRITVDDEKTEGTSAEKSSEKKITGKITIDETTGVTLDE